MTTTKKIPVLYTRHTRGSLYRHGSKNKTLYFVLNPDRERYLTDEEYRNYFDDIWNNEIFAAITNKFITTTPVMVTNDHIRFLIFKSNIDPYALKEFCKAIVQEMDFSTGSTHTANYSLIDTLFMQMDKPAPFYRGTSQGGKLTQDKELLRSLEQPLESAGDPQDNGIFMPFEAWKEEKRRLEHPEEEEIVQW